MLNLNAGQDCTSWLASLSAYVDGELNEAAGEEFEQHMGKCPVCTERVASYRAMGAKLQALPPAPVPERLGLRLRVAASHHANGDQRWLYWRMRWTMWVEALALPTALGTVMALGLFFAMVGGVRGNVHDSHRPDVLVGYGAQPPHMASMSGYQVGGSLLVEASIDATGHVYGYRVLSGHTDAQIISRLNTQLLLSVFEPATTMFGKPTNGQLLVSFGTVDVRG